jgi:hypothetical protein
VGSDVVAVWRPAKLDALSFAGSVQGAKQCDVPGHIMDEHF